ncbi:uncharacterized protein LOC114750841 [Neltuma alba]|nr:uncharacterized protein LOC114750841 [Prosopis alba]
MLVVAVACVLIYTQVLLPQAPFPHFLVQLKNWYVDRYDHYLLRERPPFFVGLIWYEFLFDVPIIVLNLYAILTAKPWFKTTCLIYGVAVCTAMTAVLPEMLAAGEKSSKLMSIYIPLIGLGVVAALRGLPSHSIFGMSPEASTKKHV